MNRDEKRTRALGLPPARRNVHGRLVVYPSEPGGGTWIAVNDRGISLALINWHSVAARAAGNVVTRGEVIPAMSMATAPDRVTAGLAALPLHRINPFRLIGIFPASREIFEWRWDLDQLIQKKPPWRAQQWISSGYDEPTAQRVRSRIFSQAQGQTSTGTIGWLRRLHRSHLPQPGPFSTCMHREDAATVSYTEITLLRGTARLRHTCGPPCQGSAHSTATIPADVGCRGTKPTRPTTMNYSFLREVTRLPTASVVRLAQELA